MSKRVAIVGYGVPFPCGQYPKTTEVEMAMDAFRAALASTSLQKGDIEGLFSDATIEPDPILGLDMHHVTTYLRLEPKSMARLALGGLSGGLAVKYAMNEIQLGHIDTALVYAASRERSVTDEIILRAMKHRAFPDHGMTLYEPVSTQPYVPFSAIPIYALSARRYMHESGAREEHFAMAAVRNRKGAMENPWAAFRDPLTVEEVMKSRKIATPIKLLDCCASLDGAAAIVLAGEEKARKITDSPVWIRGWGEHHDKSTFIPTDGVQGSICRFVAAEVAARRAYERTGLSAKDVDVADIYAPFSPQELILPEDLGLYPRGGMVKAIEEGETEYDGRVPINTDGGVTSRGHPFSVTPMYEFINIVRQLRGEAPRQVKDPRVGLIHVEGGMVNSSLVFLLEAG